MNVDYAGKNPPSKDTEAKTAPSPKRTSSAHPNTAPQLLHRCHSLTAQHLIWPSVCCADEESKGPLFPAKFIYQCDRNFTY
jgi:hypothetical protein